MIYHINMKFGMERFLAEMYKLSKSSEKAGRKLAQLEQLKICD